MIVSFTPLVPQEPEDLQIITAALLTMTVLILTGWSPFYDPVWNQL